MAEKKERIIDSVETLEKALKELRKAQEIYAQYTQEPVDAIFKAAAVAANQARIPLAKLAVEETGMGIVEDKVIKNHYAAEYIYNKYKECAEDAQRHHLQPASPCKEVHDCGCKGGS